MHVFHNLATAASLVQPLVKTKASSRRHFKARLLATFPLVSSLHATSEVIHVGSHSRNRACLTSEVNVHTQPDKQRCCMHGAHPRISSYRTALAGLRLPRSGPWRRCYRKMACTLRDTSSGVFRRSAPCQRSGAPRRQARKHAELTLLRSFGSAPRLEPFPSAAHQVFNVPANTLTKLDVLSAQWILTACLLELGQPVEKGRSRVLELLPLRARIGHEPRRRGSIGAQESHKRLPLVHVLATRRQRKVSAQWSESKASPLGLTERLVQHVLGTRPDDICVE